MDTELCAAIERAVADCREKFEEFRNDAQCGTVWAERLEELEGFLKRVRAGMDRQALKADIAREIPELEADIEREDAAPTFDWYDEHHYNKVFMGRLEACRTVEKILQKQEDAAAR